MSAPRPLPKADADSAPFWAACAEGHLSAQRCPSCGRCRWPPAEFCPFCHHHGGDWVTLPGTGTIRSLVVAHRAFDPAFEKGLPYVVAHIALDGTEDGVVMIGNVVGTSPEAIAVGQRVAVEFVTVDAAALPQFRVTSAAATSETSRP
jgi:uncharacterized OB-fold protein